MLLILRNRILMTAAWKVMSKTNDSRDGNLKTTRKGTRKSKNLSLLSCYVTMHIALSDLKNKGVHKSIVTVYRGK